MEHSREFSDAIRPCIESFFEHVPPNLLTMKRIFSDHMKLAIQEMLRSIVEVITIRFSQLQDLSVQSTISGPAPIVPVLTMETVYEFLGSTISDAFADVTGISDDPNCLSFDKITEHVAEEVTDRVNFLLSNGSSTIELASEAFTNRLARMVKHAQKFLQRCIKIWDTPNLIDESSQAKPEAPAQACASEKAGLEEANSCWDFLTQTVTLPGDLVWAPQEKELCEADYRQDMNMMLESMMVSALQESEKHSGWDAAASDQKLSTPWDTQEPAEMALLLFSALVPVQTILDEQVTCVRDIKKESVSGADNLQVVGDISQDLKKLASEIITEVCEGVPAVETAPSEQLQSQSEHSSVPQSSKTSCWRRAATKVKSFCNCIGQAVHRLVNKLRRTKNSEQDIRTPSQELPDGVKQGVEIITTPEQDPKTGMSMTECCSSRFEVSDQVTEETIVCDKVTEETVCDKVTEETVVCDKVTEETIVCDKVTEETVVCDKVTEETIVCDQVTDETVVSDKVTEETVVSDKVTDKVTTEAVEQPGCKWDRISCKVLVMTLVQLTLKKTTVDTEQHDCQKIALKLGEKLWAEVSSSVINIEVSQIIKIVKAVQKDMIKNLGGQKMVESCLLSDKSSDHTLIVGIIKKHLVEKKKKSAFRSFLKLMRKIFRLA